MKQPCVLLLHCKVYFGLFSAEQSDNWFLFLQWSLRKYSLMNQISISFSSRLHAIVKAVALFLHVFLSPATRVISSMCATRVMCFVLLADPAVALIWGTGAKQSAAPQQHLIFFLHGPLLPYAHARFWWTVVGLGPVSLTFFPSQFKFDASFVSLSP